jgi:hypothetical protein
MQYIISSKKPFFFFNMNPEPSLMSFQEEAANIVFNLNTVAWERWAVGAPISPKVVDKILQKLNKRPPLGLLSEATSAAYCMGNSRDAPSDIERVAMEINSGVKQFISGINPLRAGAANPVPLLQTPNLGLPQDDMVQSKALNPVEDLQQQINSCCMSLHLLRRQKPCCFFCIVLWVMLIGGLILMGLVITMYCEDTKLGYEAGQRHDDDGATYNATWCYRNIDDSPVPQYDDDGEN